MYHDREVATYAAVTTEQLTEVAANIVGWIDKVRIWLFEGDLGVGKTTLIKEVCRMLGVNDSMSSPTFSIVNEYNGRTFGTIYHFDFYRIKKEVEAYDIGIEEYFDSGNPCFIEWPEKIPSLIPATHAVVTINIVNESQRSIAISVHDGKEENRF